MKLMIWFPYSVYICKWVITYIFKKKLFFLVGYFDDIGKILELLFKYF